jgi:uncharacterized protein (TIGR02453 family)
MSFSGWSPEAVAFFDSLGADNTKAFWTAHRDFYEASVREPMAELLDELSAEFGPGRIARPYRDIRFRADKSPYKTEIYATLDRGGYVRFSADGLTAADGYYMMTPAQLDRYRRAVCDDSHGARLAALVERLRGAGAEVGGTQTLKTAPRGYPPGHPRIGLLRCKGLICWQRWPVAPWLSTPEARDRVAGFLRATAPLRQWLGEHVGPDPAGLHGLRALQACPRAPRRAGPRPPAWRSGQCRAFWLHSFPCSRSRACLTG